MAGVWRQNWRGKARLVIGGMLFLRAWRTTRSAIKGVLQIRKNVELSIWGELSIFQNAWWKTPTTASMP
jgi:hypothetical protein